MLSWLLPWLNCNHHVSAPVGRVVRESSPRVVVYYPTGEAQGSSASWWTQGGLGTAATGYAHMALGRKPKLRHGTWLFWGISCILRAISWVLPLNWAKLPNVYEKAAPPEKAMPVLIWSHGLTGTGEEHGLFAAALAAQQGIVVALVHHSDGSPTHTHTHTTTIADATHAMRDGTL